MTAPSLEERARNVYYKLLLIEQLFSREDSETMTERDEDLFSDAVCCHIREALEDGRALRSLSGATARPRT